jgi:hypothetical protein
LELYPAAGTLAPTQPEVEAIDEPPPAPWTGWRITRWASIGAGAVALGLGIYHGVWAHEIANDVEELRLQNVRNELTKSRRDAARQKALIADLSFVVTGLAGGTWGASWFFEEN